MSFRALRVQIWACSPSQRMVCGAVPDSKGQVRTYTKIREMFASDRNQWEHYMDSRATPAATEQTRLERPYKRYCHKYTIVLAAQSRDSSALEGRKFKKGNPAISPKNPTSRDTYPNTIQRPTYYTTRRTTTTRRPAFGKWG
ncbi:uncharacterized protein [Dermacentor albipictus]|uniref:uncharacterized protein isoform X2 n=1 Tax=Dermacentor albipictus TaxID=60249 RepID=UPI0038FC3A4C